MRSAGRILFFSMLFIIIADCISKRDAGPDLTLNLRWNKSYERENHDSINTGMLWAFSFLGADLPEGSYRRATSWVDAHTLKVDLSMLGFNTRAQAALGNLVTMIRGSEEYRAHHAIDAGRFIMITLGEPRNYYAITGVEKTYRDFRSSFTYHPRQVGLIRSSVSLGHRLLEMPVATGIKHLGYIAKEGEGSLYDGSFSVKEYEVFDVMSNGQFRFAVYDRGGNLMSTANKRLSKGGKPLKCIWCHEININPAFTVSDSVTGYASYQSFTDSVYSNRLIVDQYRQSLQTDVSFARKQDHTLMELIYISFMEPSAERLAREWNMGEAAVKKKLRGLKTHRHIEFKYLGELYDRDAVDALSPYKVIKVQRSARD